MRTNTTYYTIEWNKDTGEERELEVEYNYSPGTNFIIHSHSLEPNDPTEGEVLSAKVNMPTPLNQNNMEDVWDDLSKHDQEKIIEHCFEDACEREQDYDEQD